MSTYFFVGSHATAASHLVAVTSLGNVVAAGREHPDFPLQVDVRPEFASSGEQVLLELLVALSTLGGPLPEPRRWGVLDEDSRTLALGCLAVAINAGLPIEAAA